MLIAQMVDTFKSQFVNTNVEKAMGWSSGSDSKSIFYSIYEYVRGDGKK
ncbi:hypothetical protein JCM15579A_10810 [Marinifilum fragile]